MASSDSELSSSAHAQRSQLAENGGTTTIGHKVGTNVSVTSSLAMRVQRKVLSKLSRRGVVRLLGENRVITLMDTLDEMLREFYEPKTAEKVVKNGIKLIFKVGLLYRENKLTDEQLRLLSDIERDFQRLALTIQSFRKVQFSYNRVFMLASIDAIHRSILNIVEQTLSEKSVKRVANVFDHFSDGDFLDLVFTSTAPVHTELVHRFAEELDHLLHTGSEDGRGDDDVENSTP